MSENVIETQVIEMDKFYPNTAEVGEELMVYRRLADMYDLSAVAMQNVQGEVVGYLDREIAESVVLPAIKEGQKFQCVVVGEGEEPNTLNVQLRQYEPQEEPDEDALNASLGLDDLAAELSEDEDEDADLSEE